MIVRTARVRTKPLPNAPVVGVNVAAIDPLHGDVVRSARAATPGGRRVRIGAPASLEKSPGIRTKPTHIGNWEWAFNRAEQPNNNEDACVRVPDQMQVEGGFDRLNRHSKHIL